MTVMSMALGSLLPLKIEVGRNSSVPGGLLAVCMPFKRREIEQGGVQF